MSAPAAAQDNTFTLPYDPVPAPVPAAPLSLPPRPLEPARPERWYGWQNLIFSVGVPAASWSAVGAFHGESAAQGGLLYFGTASLYLGSPIVHWSHGNVGTGFGSLGLLPLCQFTGAIVGAGLGRAAGPADTAEGWNPSLWFGLMIGALIGTAAAITIDTAALAWEDAPGTALAPAKTTRLRLAPVIAPVGTVKSIGLAGAF